jgi:hypothetical protein
VAIHLKSHGWDEFCYDIVTNKTQFLHPAQTYISRPPGPTTSPACATAGTTLGTCQTARTRPTRRATTLTPSIRHNGRSSRRACGAAARNAAHSASDNKFSSRAPNGAASRTATNNHAGVTGNADNGLLTGVPGTRPRHVRGLGSIPARHSAISRSSRVLIRPIRPHTATSSTVKARSRAATTAMAACSPVRRTVKFNMRLLNIQATILSTKMTLWHNLTSLKIPLTIHARQAWRSMGTAPNSDRRHRCRHALAVG